MIKAIRFAAFAMFVSGGTAQASAQAAQRADAAPAALRAEVEALSAAMIAAFKRDPASVAKFYADDARIMGGGSRATGRAEIDKYWASITGASDWKLEVIEVGGSAESPWVLGRSTLVGQGGRMMVVDFVGVLKRAADGSLKYHVDIYTSAPRAPTPPA